MFFVGKVIEFTIALKSQQEGLAALEKAFWEVSDPKSSSFGKHLSFEEVSLTNPRHLVTVFSTYIGSGECARSASQRKRRCC